MRCTLGRSTSVGLLLAAFAFLISSCQYPSLIDQDNGRSNPDPVEQVKLLVEEDGFFSVSLSDLVLGGLAIDDLNPANLRLTQGGLSVSYLIQDEQLIFYGLSAQSRYTNARPYILEVGEKGSTIQMSAVSRTAASPVKTVPQNIHLEENHIYKPESLEQAGDDAWFWIDLSQGDAFDIQVNVPHPAETPAYIRVNSWGYTDLADIEQDHSLDLALNDQVIDTILWDGQSRNTARLALPNGAISVGSNKITLDNRPEGSSFLDIMSVNWLELSYQAPPVAEEDRLAFSDVEGLVQMSGFTAEPLIFDIRNRANPVLLSGWESKGDEYLLPVTREMEIAAVGPEGFLIPEIEAIKASDWHAAQHQADLLIVTTEALVPSLDRLVEAREAQGLSVALVPVEEIYNEFGYGEASPEGIQQFVAYAYSSWQEPKPKYLFLVGDATTDFHGYLPDQPANVIPSLLVPVQFGGETISDSRLADTNGDLLPELAVGRWPIQTAEEVDSLIERTLAYEQGPSGGKMLFLADVSEARFAELIDRVVRASHIPETQVQRVDPMQESEISSKLNHGTWLAMYAGHGSITRWGEDSLFTLETVNRLDSTTPPIILQLTCLTGLFAHPSETSLVEAMLTHPGGPVLTVAATSLTLSSYQEPFAIQLLQKMQDPNIVRIGDAFQDAKLSLEIEKSDGLREISDTFALFGDPTTRIVRP